MKIIRKSDKVDFATLKDGELFEIDNGNLCMKVYPFSYHEGLGTNIVNAVNLDTAQLMGVLDRNPVTRKNGFELKEE